MMQHKQISVKCNLAFPDLSFTDMRGEYIAVCWLQVHCQNPKWIQDPWPSVNTTGHHNFTKSIQYESSLSFYPLVSILPHSNIQVEYTL